MIQYILLCKDEINGISYFFNIDDGYIYVNSVREKEESAKRGAQYGSMAIFLAYPFIGLLGIWAPSVIMGGIAAGLGILASIIISSMQIKKSASFFIAANRQETTGEKICVLYEQGKKFRKKYIGIEISMLLFSVILSLCIMFSGFNILLFMCAVAIWAVWGIMFCGKRPLCNRKFKRLFN